MKFDFLSFLNNSYRLAKNQHQSTQMNRSQPKKLQQQQPKQIKKVATKKVTKRKLSTKVTKKVSKVSTPLFSAPMKLTGSSTPSIAASKLTSPFTTKRRFFSALNTPGNIFYTKEHEYIRFDTETTATVGISDHAQELLGEVVYVELPSVGTSADKGSSFASIESVKASNDVYAPVSLKVLQANEELGANPGMVNSDPEGSGWFVKVEVADVSQFESLMKPNDYKAYLETQDH
jgi:glycine cleavage system H protein